MTKEEKKAYNKAYRQTNKEKLRAYYEANKEEKKAYNKAYNEANKEKLRAYYEANKEDRRAYHKAYNEANKEKRKAYHENYFKTEKGKQVRKKGNERYFKKLNLANAKISQRTLAAWALQVKERDGNTCQICFSTDNLHAHHILSKSKHPSLALILNNGVTLCEACHIEEHRLNGDL